MRKIVWLLGIAGLTLLAAPLWADRVTADEPIENPTPKPTLAPPIVPTPAPATVSPGGLSQKDFSIEVSPFISFPASGNTANQFNMGGGFEAFLNFAADKNLLIGLDGGLEDFPINNAFVAKTFQQTYGIAIPPGVTITGDLSCIPILAMAKYSIGNNKVRPYLLWGMGFGFNKANSSVSYKNQTVMIAASETSFFMTPGLGLTIPLDVWAELFFQIRIDLDFTSQNNSDTAVITLQGSTAPPQTLNGNLTDDSPTIFIPLQVGIRL